MAEWVGEGDALRSLPLDTFTFAASPCRQRTLGRLCEIVYHEIDMNCCPVTCVPAPVGVIAVCIGRCGILKKADSGGRASQFRHIVIKNTGQPQVKRSCVECDGRSQIRHVDIDDKVHGFFGRSVDPRATHTPRLPFRSFMSASRFSSDRLSTYSTGAPGRAKGNDKKGDLPPIYGNPKVKRDLSRGTQITLSKPDCQNDRQNPAY